MHWRVTGDTIGAIGPIGAIDRARYCLAMHTTHVYAKGKLVSYYIDANMYEVMYCCAACSKLLQSCACMCMHADEVYTRVYTTAASMPDTLQATHSAWEGGRAEPARQAGSASGNAAGTGGAGYTT